MERNEVSGCLLQTLLPCTRGVCQSLVPLPSASSFGKGKEVILLLKVAGKIYQYNLHQSTAHANAQQVPS